MIKFNESKKELERKAHIMSLSEFADGVKATDLPEASQQQLASAQLKDIVAMGDNLLTTTSAQYKFRNYNDDPSQMLMDNLQAGKGIVIKKEGAHVTIDGNEVDAGALAKVLESTDQTIKFTQKGDKLDASFDCEHFKEHMTSTDSTVTIGIDGVHPNCKIDLKADKQYFQGFFDKKDEVSVDENKLVAGKTLIFCKSKPEEATYNMYKCKATTGDFSTKWEEVKLHEFESTDGSIEITTVSEGDTNLSIKKLKSDLFTSDDDSVTFSDKDGKVNIKATGGGGTATPITAGVGASVAEWKEIHKIQVISPKGHIGDDKILQIPYAAYEIGEEGKEGHTEGHYHTIKESDTVKISVAAEGEISFSNKTKIKGNTKLIKDESGSFDCKDFTLDMIELGNNFVVRTKDKKEGETEDKKLVEGYTSFFGIFDRQVDLLDKAFDLRYGLAKGDSTAWLRKSKTAEVGNAETLYYQVWSWSLDTGDLVPTEAQIKDVGNWSRDTKLSSRGTAIVSIGPNGSDEETKSWDPADTATQTVYPPEKHRGQIIRYANWDPANDKYYISTYHNELWHWDEVNFFGGATLQAKVGASTTYTNIEKVEIKSQKATIADRTLTIPNPVFQTADSATDTEYEVIKEGEGVTFTVTDKVLTIKGDYMELSSDDESIEIGEKTQVLVDGTNKKKKQKTLKVKKLKKDLFKDSDTVTITEENNKIKFTVSATAENKIKGQLGTASAEDITTVKVLNSNATISGGVLTLPTPYHAKTDGTLEGFEKVKAGDGAKLSVADNTLTIATDKEMMGIYIKGEVDDASKLTQQSDAKKGDVYVVKWKITPEGKQELLHVNMLVQEPYTVTGNWLDLGPVQGPQGKPGEGFNVKGWLADPLTDLIKEATAKKGDAYVADTWKVGANPNKWFFNEYDKDSSGDVRNYIFMLAEEGPTTLANWKSVGPLRGRPGTSTSFGDIDGYDEDGTITRVSDVRDLFYSKGFIVENNPSHSNYAYINLNPAKVIEADNDSTIEVINVPRTEGVGNDNKVKLRVKKLRADMFKNTSTVSVSESEDKIQFNATANISAKIEGEANTDFINLVIAPKGSEISNNTLTIKGVEVNNNTINTLEAGNGISLTYSSEGNKATIATTGGGGGGSNLTIKGRDILDENDKSTNDGTVEFGHMFSLDEKTDGTGDYTLRLRHEGALLGFYHSFESGLVVAAKQHKSDWSKGKVVGGVFVGAEGEATSLIAIDIYTWKQETITQPTVEQLKDKNNWEKVTVSQKGLSTAIAASPPTSATHPHKTWKGQIVYCENTQGGAAGQKGFYFSDGANWKKMDIDGTGGSAINISGQYNSGDVLKDGQETWAASEVDFSTRDFELTKSASYATDKKVTVKSRGWAISDKSGPKSPNSHGFKIVGQEGVDVTVEDEAGSAKIIVKGTGGSSSDLTVSGKDETSGQPKDIPNVTKIAFDVDQFYVKESTEGEGKNATVEFAGLPIKMDNPSFDKKADELKFAGDVTLSESDGTVTVTVASGGDITFEGKAKDLTDVTMVPKKVKLDSNNFTLAKDETAKTLSVNYRGLPVSKKGSTGDTTYATSLQFDGNVVISKEGESSAVVKLGAIAAAGKILGGDELPSSTDMRKITFSANNAYVKTTGIVSGGQDIEVTPAIAVKGQGSGDEYKPLSQVDMTNSDKESYSLTPATKTSEGNIALKVKQPVISAGTLDELKGRYPASTNTHRFAFVDSSSDEGLGDTLYYSTPEGGNEQGVGNTIYYSHSGTEGAKWKTLAYPEMDQDVRDLTYRYPQRLTERKTGYKETDCRNIDYIYVKKEDVIKPSGENGLGFDKDDFSVYVYKEGMGDGLLHNIFGVKQEGTSQIEYWVQILYNMGSSGGTYIRQKVDKKGSTTTPKEREWSKWGRMGIAALTAANHSVLISDNDYSYKALRDNGNALPLRLYQDPTSNIAFDTAVGKAGGFKVNRSGYYDIYVRTQYTWETRGKYKKDSKGQIQLWQDYPDWFSTTGKGSKLASLVTTGNIAFNDKEDIYPFKGKFEKKFLQAGKTYFVCSGFQNNDEGTEENLQLDPFKNMISIDPSPTETGGFKTAEAIVDTLYHSLSGLSFDVGYEVRAEQEGTSGKGKILGEAYNTTLTDTIPDTVVGA